MRHGRSIRVLSLLVSGAAAGCGGESGITDPEAQPVPSFVRLQSDAGDYVGAGQSYEYTALNAVIVVTARGGLLSVDIRGDERWSGQFQAPIAHDRLQRGDYSGLMRYPFHNPVFGGLNWGGEGRGCNRLSGSFTIDSVAYDNGNLRAIDLRFEQHCEGFTPALRGTIHWRADDPTVPPGPVNPVPAGLWSPPAGATPSAGRHVYLESEAGDFIGRGQTYAYTEANAILTITATGGRLSVRVQGDQWWFGDFQTMNTLGRLEVGYYPNLRRYPFHNPVKGGLSWFGEGRGCNTLRGWFVVDQVTYTNGILASVNLRFEQRCEGGTPALHGVIRWRG